MNISVVGTGYVGIVTGACFAHLGHNVICVDVDVDRVNKVNNAESPMYEKGLDKLLKKYTKNEKLKATTDLKDAVINSDITFICVGTPSGLLEDVELKYVQDVSKSIGKVLKDKDAFHIVITKSTVVPGTAEHDLIPLIEKISGKKANEDFGVGVNPEFLRQGNAVEDFLKPDKIVFGYNEGKTANVLRELYKDFTCPVVETDLKTAEMIKYANNAFLVTKISFINEIGNVSKLLGIDTHKVAEAIGLDKRIGRHFLRPGIGFGGSCFGKDVKALINKSGEIYHRPLLLNAALEVNEYQPSRLVELLEKRNGNLRNKEVIILGLAFKPDTDDMRDAPSIKIVKMLLAKGAKVHVHDPEALDNARKIFGDDDRIVYHKSLEEVIKQSKYVILVTEWNDYRNEELYRGKEVFDGRNVKEAKELSEHYEGVCW